MKNKTLGESDLAIAPIMFGGNVFGWTIDEKTSFEILDRFTSDGFNAIDTANSYSHWKPGNKGGESETIIGNWLRKRNHRNDVVIATKVGSAIGGKGVQLKKNYIINEAEKSLQRLQTDYIDLYFSHYDDINTPIEEPLLAYEQLIKEGKVRWIGASNFSAARLQEAIVSSSANNLPQYQVYQPGYNLYDRADFEKEHASICKEFNIGVVPYYSLASGFLSGKYRNHEDLALSLRGAGVAKYLTDRGLKIIEALDKVANKHQTQMAAVALAWLIQQPNITAPIASATKLDQLLAFRQATSLNLDFEDLQILNQAST